MRKRIMNYVVSLVVAIALLAAPVSNVQAAAGWKAAYQGILNNWRAVEKYENTSYMKSYFGSNYVFDRYYLYDLDKNKTPELFLYSTKMGLTIVLTYKNKKLVSLGCHSIKGINKAKKEIFTRGHWHGSGGSGIYEWAVYKIKNNSLVMTQYIDKLGKSITIYDGKSYNKGTLKQYNAIYKAHIKKGTKVSRFTKYKLSDKKGLRVQK